MAESFSYKITSESELFGFDYSQVLASGETISSAVASVLVMNGIDLNPSAILVGAPSISGNKVSQRISGGNDGVTYRIEMVATTSLGNVYACVGDLPVYSVASV